MRQLVLAAIALSTLPSAGAAQSRDSLPFRAGQWGVEVAGVTAATGATLLRFDRPDRGWAFTVSGSTTSAREDVSEESDFSANLSIARRWYATIVPRVVRYSSVGVSLNGVAGDSEVYFSGVRFTRRIIGGRVFGEFGAAWLVTRNLSLGASLGAGLGYTRSRTTQRLPGSPSETNTERIWGLGFGTTAVRASLYF